MVLAVASLLTGSLMVVLAGAPGNSRLASDLLQSALAVLAGISAVWVTKASQGFLRRLWLLFSISVFLVCAAQILKTYYKNIAHLPFAAPWPSDILYILWVIPALMMFLPRPGDESGRIDWTTILDFFQVGIVALTAYLYFFYLTSRWQAEGTQMVSNVFRVQMYRDLVITVAFAIGSRTSASRAVKTLFRGVAVFFVLEAGWAALIVSRPILIKTNWDEVAWCAPYLFLTAFAWRWKSEEYASSEQPFPPAKSTIFSRVLPVCMPLVVLWMSLRIAHGQMTLAWAAITASFLVSTARLILTNERQLRIADDLRKVEAALQQSSQMVTSAFRSSLDAISISSVPDGRYLIVNESFLRMTGYTQEEVLGKSAAELRMWVDKEQHAQILARLYSGAEIRQEEFLMRTKTGEVRTGQVSASRINLGDKIGVLGMVRDVTARRRAEEALRVSEERFRTLVQDLHIGIVLLGPGAETLFANRAVLKTFGVRNEQVAGKSSAQFEATAIREDGSEMPFEERPAPRAIATKEPVYGEVVGWRHDGSDEILWTLVDAVPHITPRGEVANVILSISDITERKKAEEALQRSEERFRTLVENLHVGVALMGPKAEILFANQAALAMFGLSLEQVLGKTSEELGFIALREDGTELPFEKRPAPQVLATGQAVRSEVMGWRREGEEETLWILGEVVPLSSRDGRPDRLVTAFSDITKRKEAEEALHRLSARLLHLQDEERRRLGRELHDSLAQSVMAVNLDLAQVNRSPATLDKRARNALSEARKVLREMSREIRTLSYLLHPPVLDELGLASAIREYAHGFSERSGIALEIDIQPDFPRMPQEAETAFFRIVQESLANIQKHSGSSTGAIRLWKGQGRVQLEIRDQGQGMAANLSGNGVVPRASRLGVGILGMRERMAQLGGTLEVQSSASGTAVHATIPLVREATHDSPSDPRG
ncbi:MAG TPA: PAS domain S-box protein [Candidatus Acidoferrum sp.]|nr:PAS domain S-box protein [Candidatus Acidoferrum sp.]